MTSNTLLLVGLVSIACVWVSAQSFAGADGVIAPPPGAPSLSGHAGSPSPGSGGVPSTNSAVPGSQSGDIESILEESCTLLGPYGSEGSQSYTWGAFPPSTQRIYPQTDGAFLGIGWGMGSPVPHTGATGYRCCNEFGCHDG
jgi:hypothetical protein